MLKVRIIPTILLKGAKIVKGKSFNAERTFGTLLPAVKVYNSRQVDELIIVDILATKEKRPPDFESIREASLECFVPLTAGGGIRTMNDVTKMLRAGADKVSLNSICFERQEFISEVANRFGSQCVVASIDVRQQADGRYLCYSHAGRTKTSQEVVNWAQTMEALGSGEILLTSIDLDGTRKGYDLELLKLVTKKVKIPVIISGGAKDYDDFYRAYKAGASGLAAASIYQYTQSTPSEAKKYLAKKGVPVRI